jgi:hypothetical protein
MLTFVLMDEDTCKTVILIILTALVVVVVVVKVRKRECTHRSHSLIWFCHVVTQLKNNNNK